MRCVSSLIANRGSANHIGRFFFFLFLFAVTEAHKKVIMEEKWDLAQWITTCNIDLFERRITLGFPLVGLMNRILIWCPSIKSWDRRQQPASSWRPRHPFWTRRDTCDCGVVPLCASVNANIWSRRTLCIKHERALLRGDHRVELLSHQTVFRACMCGFEGGQIAHKKAETRPMIWHKAVTLSGFVVNHNIAPQCRKRPLFACYRP